MLENKTRKPVLKPKPSVSTKITGGPTQENSNPTLESLDSAAASVSSTLDGDAIPEAPRPRLRKSKLKKDEVATSATTPQQTRPPDDVDTVLMVSSLKSIVSFEDDLATPLDPQQYSTIPRTMEKKIMLKKTDIVIHESLASSEDIFKPKPGKINENASNIPSLSRVCWKSEEVLSVEPAACIENPEFSDNFFNSLEDISVNQNQARIEPSPERFLDDILRKRKSLKRSPAPCFDKFELNLETTDELRLSNLIPVSLSADDDCDIDNESEDDMSSYKKDSSKSKLIVEYANLRDGKHPLATDTMPHYANLQPVELKKKSLSPEEMEQITRMNMFFGVKKDTATDIETQVFNSLLTKNALNYGFQAKKPQQQRGRRQLTHLKGNSKSNPTTHASGQLLQDLVRVKKWAADKVPVLNKSKNKSTDNLLNMASSTNQHFTSTHYSKSMDWSSWKQKFIKGVERHLKGLRSQGDEGESSVVVATFGVPLEMCPMSSNNKHVPAIVEFCVTVMENLGLSSRGVYRIPGNNSGVNELLSELNKDPDSITFENERWQDVNVIGSLLKLFFRKLPEPLMVTDLYDQIIQTAKCENRDKKLIKIKLHLCDLPVTNRETFKYLSNHLNRVAANQVVNKMDAHNLAIMFGPSLVHPRDESTNQMLSDMQYQTEIVEIIIKYCDWMFSDWTDEANIPPGENKQGHNSAIWNNPQLLANAEAILAIKSKEFELETHEESSSHFFIRHGFRRSSKNKSRNKSRSDSSSKVIPNSEREVEVKIFDLDNLTRFGPLWRSFGLDSIQGRHELKRNLTQKYASNELQISAPLKSNPSPKNIDESKNSEDAFSSIKRYPAYSFKNTTIKGSSSFYHSSAVQSSVAKHRNTSHAPIFSIDNDQSRSAVVHKVNFRADSFQEETGDFPVGRKVSNESETSDVFAGTDNWLGRKESFIVRKPEGRSYFVPTGNSPDLFTESSSSSLTSLNRLQVISMLRENSGETESECCMGKRKYVPSVQFEFHSKGEIPILHFENNQ